MSHLAENTSKNAEERLSVFFGLIDCSVVLAYSLNLEPTLWHGLTLALKGAALCIARPAPRLSAGAFAAPGIVAIAFMVLLNASVAGTDTASLLQGLGFVAHLLLTTLAIRRGATDRYLFGFAAVAALSAATHIALCGAGAIKNHFGRFLYLGNSHPNLGGEINAMAAVAVGFSLRKRGVFLALTALLISAYLMQSRASLLVIAAVFGLRLIMLTPRFVRSSTGVLLYRISLAVLSISAIAAYWASVEGVTTTLLMLNDEHRGSSSGFVGRSGRWYVASKIFEAHPVFGAGFGYFERAGLPSPHSFLWYALAEGGIISFVIIVTVIGAYTIHMARSAPSRLLLLTPTLALFLFNDRFLNLNPYPFVFFVILLAGFNPERESDANCRHRRYKTVGVQ